MEGKDNRSKVKHGKMKQHYNNKWVKQRNTAGNTTTSSSPQQAETVRSVVDVADSSDEQRLARRKGWSQHTSSETHTLMHQRNRDRLDMDELRMSDDESIQNIENAQMRAGDFKQMSQVPSAGCGHFFLSSERNWESAADTDYYLLQKSEASAYFTLNIHLLNAGLQTIPFYKRMDYGAHLFTRDQLNAMNESAEISEKIYQNILGEHQSNPRIQIKSASQRSGGNNNSANSRRAKTAPTPPASTQQNDELDELLNMTTTEVSQVVLDNVEKIENVAAITDANGGVATAASNNKEDIQDWLDNVLDE